MLHAWLLLGVTLVTRQGHASQVLMFTQATSRSHKIPFIELGNGLMKRGHNVTFISPFPRDRTSYLEEITPAGLVFYVGNFTHIDMLGARMRNEDPISLLNVVRYGYESCDALLSDPETQQLLRSGRHFDLVILDGVFPDCGLGFAHHFKAPYVYINVMAPYTVTLSLAGNPGLYSVTPYCAKSFTDNMGFWQRIQNSYYTFVASSLQAVQARVLHSLLLSKHWPDMPSILDMTRNVSFILQNGHPTISYPRPYLPNVAEIGCIHCKPAKPLTQELEDFVMGSGDAGFIYVSMGSSVKAEIMPESLRLMFVQVFAQLPYRVLWKWEAGNGSMTDLSPNVMLRRWLPQQDVLGHPKLRAFVTHGGLLSLFETVYHAVPVVTMPVFWDQDGNAMKAELDGYAVKLDLHRMTADSLSRTINHVVHDPRYHDNVIKRSLLLRDHQVAPLMSAIYWTEYVIRHRGAYHLQSPAKDMNIFQYYMIDVALFALALLLIAVQVFRRSSSILHIVFKSCANLMIKKTKIVKQH